MTTVMHQLLDILIPTASVQRVSPDGSRAMLGDGSERTVWWYRTPQQAHTTVRALQIIHGQQAAPVLVAADVRGQICQQSAVVVATPAGAPLATIQHRLHAEHLHALGRQLGDLIADVHAHALPHYGSLIAGGQHSHDAWLAAKCDEAAQRLIDGGVATWADCDRLRAVIHTTLPGDSRPACLVHGSLGPEDIWVEKTGQSYRITTLTGWNAAFGGRPAADHVRLHDACAEPHWLPLRVGYGETYDERSQRPADQLRERSLLPERLVWMAMRAGSAALRAQRDEAARCFLIVKRWCDALDASATTREEEY